MELARSDQREIDVHFESFDTKVVDVLYKIGETKSACYSCNRIADVLLSLDAFVAESRDMMLRFASFKLRAMNDAADLQEELDVLHSAHQQSLQEIAALKAQIAAAQGK